MEARTYSKVIDEINHHWATEGMNIHTGDDGFSEAVYDAMGFVGRESEDINMEKNKFYGKVYQHLRDRNDWNVVRHDYIS